MKYFLLILFLIGFASAICSDEQIDINSADLDELDLIVWVGPATAEKIILERPFDSIDDLDDVYGIGESKLKDIIDEGIACVDDTEIEEVDDDKEPEKEKIIEVKETKNIVEIISLNDLQVVEEVVYESKNSLVMKYLPYVFSVFLVLIIAVLAYVR